MKEQEFKFSGMALNGIAMLILLALVTIGSVALFVFGISNLNEEPSNIVVGG